MDTIGRVYKHVSSLCSSFLAVTAPEVSKGTPKGAKDPTIRYSGLG